MSRRWVPARGGHGGGACIAAHGGKLVKRLGHGAHGVFRDATGALGAAIDMRETVDGLPGRPPPTAGRAAQRPPPPDERRLSRGGR